MSTERQRKVELLSHSGEELLLGRRMLDLDNLCQKRFSIKSTQFLSPEEQEYCMTLSHVLDSELKMYGGYDNAERCVAILFPNGIEELEEEEIPFTALRIRLPKDNDIKIGHRDVLGAVLGLGIERDTVGDILIGKEEVTVFVMNEILPYLMQNLSKIGHANVSPEKISLSEVSVPEVRTEEINCTVASLRLDCVIAEGFRLSRETAKEAVKRQLVQINHKIIESASGSVKVNDVISLRGKGKIILEEISGESKKGRIWIKLVRYI